MVNKLRAAIKAKFEELSAENDVHIDEELPDLVVMMVNLKRSIAYMAHRLVFFLGIDTERFMEWLQGVLEDFDPLELQSDSSGLEKTQLCESDLSADGTNTPNISTDSSVKAIMEPNSAADPTRELRPSEADISIKPEAGDERKDDDAAETGTNPDHADPAADRPTSEIFRSPPSGTVSFADKFRPAEASLRTRTVSRKQQLCKFWPKCMRGDGCLYLHPTTHGEKAASKGKPCKFWPNCWRGETCLYLHPQKQHEGLSRCMLGSDEQYAKPDYPFSHFSGRSAVAPPPGSDLTPPMITAALPLTGQTSGEEQMHLLRPASLESISASHELLSAPGSEDGSMFQLPLYKEDPAVVDWSVQASMGSDDLCRLDRLEPYDLSPPSELSMTAECQVRLIQKLQGRGPRSEGFPVEQIPVMCSYFPPCPQRDSPVYHPQHCHFAADHLSAQYTFYYPDHLWVPETQYSSGPQSLTL